VTLGCEGAGELATWLLPNRANTSGTLVLHHTGDLLILRAAPAAAGVYTCTAGDTATSFTTRVELRVRTVPESVANITVIPHAVYATGKVSICKKITLSRLVFDIQIKIHCIWMQIRNPHIFSENS
jgi:hypothetical protein